MLYGLAPPTDFHQHGVLIVHQPLTTRMKLPTLLSAHAALAHLFRMHAGLAAAAGAVKHGIASGEGGPSLPGMIFNLSKQITYTPAAAPGAPAAEPRVVHAGRMECTMQNLADALTQRFPEPLDPAATAELGTFVVFNERRYVTSSAKRARQPGSAKVAQTPEGALRSGASLPQIPDSAATALTPTPRPCHSDGRQPVSYSSLHAMVILAIRRVQRALHACTLHSRLTTLLEARDTNSRREVGSRSAAASVHVKVSTALRTGLRSRGPPAIRARKVQAADAHAWSAHACMQAHSWT